MDVEHQLYRILGDYTIDPAYDKDLLPDGYPGFEELSDEVRARLRRDFDRERRFLIYTKPDEERKAAWDGIPPDMRRAALFHAQGCLEVGRLDTLRQEYLMPYPELLDFDPRFAKVLEEMADRPVVELSEWEKTPPYKQMRDMSLCLESLRQGDKDCLNIARRWVHSVPEMAALDPRLADVLRHEEKFPYQSGGKANFTWKSFSIQGQAAMLMDFVSKSFQGCSICNERELATFPLREWVAMQKLDPRLEALNAGKAKRWTVKDGRIEGGFATWQDLDEDLRGILLDACLEQLEKGNIESVENDLEQYPPLRLRDPRLKEIWKAMKKREKE